MCLHVCVMNELGDFLIPSFLFLFNFYLPCEIYQTTLALLPFLALCLCSFLSAFVTISILTWTRSLFSISDQVAATRGAFVSCYIQDISWIAFTSKATTMILKSNSSRVLHVFHVSSDGNTARHRPEHGQMPAGTATSCVAKYTVVL